MLKLDLQGAPYWIDIGEGVRLLVRPATTEMIVEMHTELAPTPDADPGEFDPAELGRDAAVALAKFLAHRAIVGWEGVGDVEGNAVDPSPEYIDALMDVFEIWASFQEQYVLPALGRDAEKNVFAPSPSTISTGARPTAPTAPKTAPARTKSTNRKASKGSPSGT